MSLRKKTISGVLWNTIETFGGKVIQIGITIVLARLLAPDDFGIIGLLVIFTELSKVLLDSGFSQALIRKKDAKQNDFSSVFFFNIFVGIFLYCLLFILSPAISRFYEFPELKDIARVTFLTIFFNSFGIVQNAKIVRDINFKILAKRTIISNLIAGIIAVILAYLGFGVWALVWQMVIAAFFRVVLLWSYSKWMPSFKFNFEPIKRLFPFSVNLLISGFLDVIASNIQTLLIGKFYAKADLGFYTQASQLSRFSSETLTSIIRNVTYPTLSAIQDNVEQLKQAYRKVIGLSVFIISPLMLGLMAIGNILIPLLIGQKWEPAVPYFTLMCIIGAVFPLYSISQNIFLVRGNSRMYLKISITKRIITLTAIFMTIRFGVFTLVVGQVVATLINTLITMIYSGRGINYYFKEQILDISKTIIASLFMASTVYLIGQWIAIDNKLILVSLQIVSGIILFLSISYLFKNASLFELKNILSNMKKKS